MYYRSLAFIFKCNAGLNCNNENSINFIVKITVCAKQVTRVVGFAFALRTLFSYY